MFFVFYSTSELDRKASYLCWYLPEQTASAGHFSRLFTEDSSVVGEMPSTALLFFHSALPLFTDVLHCSNPLRPNNSRPNKRLMGIVQSFEFILMASSSARNSLYEPA